MAFGVELRVGANVGEQMPLARMGPIERKDLNTLPPFDEELATFLKPTFATQLRELTKGGPYFDYLNDDPDNLHWGIFSARGELIGMTGFRNVGAVSPPIMRIALLNPEYMGHGYGNSATFLRTFAIHRVYGFESNTATIHGHNAASSRAASRFGYVVTNYIDDGDHGRFELEQRHPDNEYEHETIEHATARARVMGALGVGDMCIQVGELNKPGGVARINQDSSSDRQPDCTPGHP